MSDWADWAQNRRIEETEAQLASERRARSRLAEQMRAQQGSLQAQIDRLADALAAMLEHEDIRGELGQHAEAAAVRRHARDVVAAVVVTGSGVVRDGAEPRDIPGYWLAAAVRGLTTREADPAGSAALLAEAARRDPLRTAGLLTLLDCQARRVDWSTGHLDAVLPRGAAVSPLQRQVWLAVADGRLGAPARDALTAALRAAVARLDPDEVAAAVGAGLGVTAPALRLTRLRRSLEGGGLTADDAQPRVPTVFGAVDEPRAAPTEPEDPLADCLRALVDAGSPAEGDILQRMTEVRRKLGYDDAGNEHVDVVTPTDDLLDLLLADLTAPTAAPGRGAHGVAVQALEPVLTALADRLHAAALEPAPDSTEATAGRDTVRVTVDGAEPGWEARAETYADATTPVAGWLAPTALGLLAVGVLGLALGFVAGGFFALAVVGLVGAAAATIALTQQRSRRDDARAAAVRRARNQIEAAVRSLDKATTERVEAIDVARVEREKVRSLLAG